MNIICLVNILIYKMSSVGLLFVAVTEYKKSNSLFWNMVSDHGHLALLLTLGLELHGGKHVAMERCSPMAARTKCTLQKHAPGVGGEGSAGLT